MGLSREEIMFMVYAKEHLDYTPTLMDVGANHGDYTYEYLKAFPDAKVYCFEPIGEVYEELVDRFSDNKNVICYNYGLYNEEIKGKEFYYLLGREYSGMSSIHYREVYFPRFENIKISVDLYRVDDIYKSLDKVDYLKIDTEGSEWMVIDGARKFFDEVPPKFVQWEYGGCYIDSKTLGKDVLQFFAERGYTTFNFMLQETLPENFKEDYELINYLSVKI